MFVNSFRPAALVIRMYSSHTLKVYWKMNAIFPLSIQRRKCCYTH